MSTFKTLHHLFFKGLQKDAVKSTLARLGKRRMGVVQSQQMPGSKKFLYHLTEKGANKLGLKASIGQPPGNSMIPHRYAMLQFVCHAAESSKLTICRPEDFPKFFEQYGTRPPKIDFYFREQLNSKSDAPDISLGFAITDLGKNHRRVVDRTNTQLKKILERGQFSQMIIEKRFEFSILTESFGRKNCIEMELTKGLMKTHGRSLRSIMPDGLGIFPISSNVHIVKGLFDLIPGRKDQPKRIAKKG